ncbi:MAG TPA: sugar transferase [Aliiroseovarius sp.]|nr:sugar transferase [Aliiroseovarius sp.]
MSPSKRIFDIVLAIVLLVLMAPVMVVIAALIWSVDGRPVFYVSLRARDPVRNFSLWKFRTMTDDPADSGVTGGDKRARITRTGKVLRRTRLDELPQLWNVLRGDMSFVGPRPPLPRYVKMYPEIYRKVLASRPGLTGLATLAFHRSEERILARCRTAGETERAYTRRCIPRKAQLDLAYAANRSICSDALLIVLTAMGQKGRRLLKYRLKRRQSAK